MCRYSYISGACANRRVESMQCIGENECEFSCLNVLGAVPDLTTAGDSHAEEWHQLYCDTHGRYLCRGKEACSPPSVAPKGRMNYRQHRLVDDSMGFW